MMLDYSEFWQRLAAQAPDLAGDLHDLRGLGGVMAWMTRHGIALSAVEIVQQDEFSLDFVVPLGDGRHLVFGIT